MFVIQHNLLSNAHLLKIREAVQSLPHRFVGLIPFSREIVSDEPLDGIDFIPYGSTSFVETAYDLGWTGLYFDKERFCYRTACQNRDDMLNDDDIMGVADALQYLRTLPETQDLFMRPAHDLKQFSGNVYTAKEAADFLYDAMTFEGSGSYKLPPDLLIVLAQPKNLMREERWFVVGGTVIEGSAYRVDGQLHSERLTADADVKMAQSFADKWLPHECCVMDLATLGDGGQKVVEFNCINGSGFYDHDIAAVMTAWYAYYENI